MNYLACVSGTVVKGYGRGARELGFPTANLSSEAVDRLAPLGNGVYYGYCKLKNQVFPMVMSIGKNDFYKNDKKSAEVHILETFEDDFYGETLGVIVFEFIREQKDFENISLLIEAINNDIRLAKQKLSTKPVPLLEDFCKETSE